MSVLSCPAELGHAFFVEALLSSHQDRRYFIKLASREVRNSPRSLISSVQSRARLRSASWGSPLAVCSRHIWLESVVNCRTSFWSHVWLMPRSRAQARPDGLLGSRQVSHRKTYRRIISPSSLLRQGRGGRHFAFAFARFLMEDSNDGTRPPALSF